MSAFILLTSYCYELMHINSISCIFLFDYLLLLCLLSYTNFAAASRYTCLPSITICPCVFLHHSFSQLVYLSIFLWPLFYPLSVFFLPLCCCFFCLSMSSLCIRIFIFLKNVFFLFLSFCLSFFLIAISPSQAAPRSGSRWVLVSQKRLQDDSSIKKEKEKKIRAIKDYKR